MGENTVLFFYVVIFYNCINRLGVGMGVWV